MDPELRREYWRKKLVKMRDHHRATAHATELQYLALALIDILAEFDARLEDVEAKTFTLAPEPDATPVLIDKDDTVEIGVAGPNSSSWIVKGMVCRDCGYNLMITQTTEPATDYWWYCSSKTCANHNGEQLGDMEECSFAVEAPLPSPL